MQSTRTIVLSTPRRPGLELCNVKRRAERDGHQTQRIAAVGHRAGGVFHGRRADRSALRRWPTRPASGGAIVTFEPGARTAWHTHPLGQTLIVTAGLGRAQIEGEATEEIRPGDVVWFPPNVRHWHGATPTTAMTHVAIAEKLNGSPVEWMDHVTDAQYRK